MFFMEKERNLMLSKEYALSTRERFDVAVRSVLMAAVFKAYRFIPERMIRFSVLKLLAMKGSLLHLRFIENLAVTFNHALNDFNAKSRGKIGRNLFINECVKGDAQRRKIARTIGREMPDLLVISPTMKCPLRCYGCYSANYAKDADLDFKVFNNLITEAKSLGIHFFVISGGEPLIYPGIYDIFAKHSDAWFQVYTSGVTLNEENARRLAECGNVNPCISVEGFEKETDVRRGNGHFKKVMAAFENLRRFKIPFGFSATATRNNNHLLMSDAFVDFYRRQGARIGWYFQYMPIGREPDLSLVPTPEQRIYRLYRMVKLREKFDMMLADFWNDGWLSHGCIAGARGYLHVNHRGDIEPCAFCQISIDNIYKKSLFETVRTSPMFGAIQKHQPYGKNYLRPCMIIDHPSVLKEVIDEVSPTATCNGGAKRLVSDLYPELEKVSNAYQPLADEAWNRLHADPGVTVEKALAIADEALQKYHPTDDTGNEAVRDRKKAIHSPYPEQRATISSPAQ
jgi:MoaA/NifB/PqqE/SkfB family radical SAM enzyme